MKIPQPIFYAKHWGYAARWMETITLAMRCVHVYKSMQGLSHKCQCLTVAWVSRVLTPSIPGEHMDVITWSERERRRKILSLNMRKKRGKQRSWWRANKRTEINCHLACVLPRQKISLIPCSLSLYGFASGGFWLILAAVVSSPILVKKARDDCGHFDPTFWTWPVAN